MIELIDFWDWTVPIHVQGASSQKLEVVPANEIYHWKADDLNFIIYIYLGGPFSLACTQLFGPSKEQIRASKVSIRSEIRMC